MILHLYQLRTVGGEMYTLACNRGVWSIQTQGFSTTKPSLARALHTLGGMVDWNVWTENARSVLRHLSGGGAI